MLRWVADEKHNLKENDGKENGRLHENVQKSVLYKIKITP